MYFRPIFIGGCDRSGTTLLGDLLGATNWTVVTPESQFIHDMIVMLRLRAFSDNEDAAKWIQNHFRFASWGLNTNLIGLKSIVDISDTRATIEAIVDFYLRQTHPYKTSADVWIDHTPDNFKYHSSLKALFPEARFIHIVRDGRAVSASIRHLDWGPNNAYTASRHWADRLHQALNVEAAEESNCLRVYFEQLVSEPEAVLQQVCNFINIPYDKKMLNGGGLVVPNFTRHQHGKVGQSPDKRIASSWKKKLSKSDIRDFESYPMSRLLLEKMDYPLLTDQPPRLSNFRVFTHYMHDFIHYILNRRRHLLMERKVISDYKSVNSTTLNTSISHPSEIV